MAKLSIIVPVYFNEDNLSHTIPCLLTLRKSVEELELVFVDDGSGDRSLDILTEFQQAEPETIRVVKLTRNFGSMSAIQAGLAYATGDCVGIISADLQDPPDLFIEMLSYWRSGIPAVYAVRQEREDSWSSRLFSNAFYYLFRKMAIPEYPSGGFDLFLIDRRVVDDINRIAEPHTNPLALVFWLGYPHMNIPYKRKAREQGKSRWTMSKKIKLMIDSFISFSYVPVRLVSALGVVYALGAFSYMLFLITSYLIWGTAVQGWTTIMLTLLFTSGMLFLTLGVLGEYLWRISDTVKQRPNYVVEGVLENKQESNHAN